MLIDLPQWFQEDDESSNEDDELSDVETNNTPIHQPAEYPERKPSFPNPPSIGIVTVDTPPAYSPIYQPYSSPPQPYISPSSSVRNLYINDYPPVIPPPPREPPPLTRRRSYDWICDGCQKKVCLYPSQIQKSGLMNIQWLYSDLQYRCKKCEDFDFCPDCYDNVWHRHLKSSFRAKRGPSTADEYGRSL